MTKTALNLFYEKEKVAVFIDGANLFATAKALGIDMDYGRLLSWASHKSQFVRAYYYTVLVEEEDYSPLRPLVDWLDYNGYTVITKVAKDYTDGSGRRRVKGNIDVEIAVGMTDVADHVDHIVLFSGDGNFKSAVESVQRRGAKVTVVSTLESETPMISDELRRQADNFVDLFDLAKYICKDKEATCS